MRHSFNRHGHLTYLLFIFYSLSYLLVQEYSALSKIALETVAAKLEYIYRTGCCCWMWNDGE